MHLFGFITKKFITMHGHMNVKNVLEMFLNHYKNNEKHSNDQRSLQFAIFHISFLNHL